MGNGSTMISPLTPVERVKYAAITHRLPGIPPNRLAAVGKFATRIRPSVMVALGRTLFVTTIQRVISSLLVHRSQENHTRTVRPLVCLRVLPMLVEMSLRVAKPSVALAIQTNIAMLERVLPVPILVLLENVVF